MNLRLISLADVKTLLESNNLKVVTDGRTIITPAAKDFIYENDMEIILNNSERPIEKCIQSDNSKRIDNDKILSALKSILNIDFTESDFNRLKDAQSSFQIVRTSTRSDYEVFDTGVSGNKVYYKEILSSKESPNIAAGFLKIIDSTFPWHLSYDEIDFIMEGDVTIKINGKEYTAYTGDIIDIPKGSDVISSAKEYTKLLYITYPANWSDLL